MLRVRWRGVASVAAAAAVLGAGVGAAPALLEPPDPPPLAADVGLPRIPIQPSGRDLAPEAPIDRRPSRREPRHSPAAMRDRDRPPGQGSADRGERRRDRHEQQPREQEPVADDLPADAPDPEPAYVAPAPYVPPPPAPSAPAGDGSQEFAPR